MMFILNVNAYYITFSACYCCYCCLVLTHRRTVPLKAEGEKIVGEKLFFQGESSTVVQYQEPAYVRQNVVGPAVNKFVVRKKRK